jgi:hypothetical protein
VPCNVEPGDGRMIFCSGKGHASDRDQEQTYAESAAREKRPRLVPPSGRMIVGPGYSTGPMVTVAKLGVSSAGGSCVWDGAMKSADGSSGQETVKSVTPVKGNSKGAPLEIRAGARPTILGLPDAMVVPVGLDHDSDDRCKTAR